MAGDLDPQSEADLLALSSAADADFTPASSAPGAQSGIEGMDSEGLCKFALGMLFDLLAVRRGAHWKLTEAEVVSLGVATSRVLDKYLPNLNTGPEAALVLAAAMIVVPRVMQDRAPAAQIEGAGGSQP